MASQGKWEISQEFPAVSWKTLTNTHLKFVIGPEVDIFNNGGHSVVPTYEKMFIHNFLDIKLKLAFQSNLLFQFVPTSLRRSSHALFNTTLQRQPSFKDVFVLLVRADTVWNVVDLIPSDKINELFPKHGLDPLRSFPGRPKVFPDNFHFVIPEDFPIQLTVKDAGKVLNSFLAHQLRGDQSKTVPDDSSKSKSKSQSLLDYIKKTPPKEIQKRFQEAVRIAMRRMNAHQSEMIPYLVIFDQPVEKTDENGKPVRPRFRVDCGYIIPMCLSSSTLRAPDTCLALQAAPPSATDAKEDEKSTKKSTCLFEVTAILPPDQAFLHASLAGYVDSLWLNLAFSTKMHLDAQIAKERQKKLEDAAQQVGEKTVKEAQTTKAE
ncbi:hypothetical protein BLNAU_12691 [Blattamonas nauphoetae]|uniref:Uncharacterized protein n=1 Tax=Blattamonas nauphoetae TaxID=2049346 RepID=A0ABQ9XL15_9EUKA|nr:hypothetical protein BLNAU_12691 [Blattamonas nauphoetae]